MPQALPMANPTGIPMKTVIRKASIAGASQTVSLGAQLGTRWPAAYQTAAQPSANPATPMIHEIAMRTGTGRSLMVAVVGREPPNALVHLWRAAPQAADHLKVVHIGHAGNLTHNAPAGATYVR